MSIAKHIPEHIKCVSRSVGYALTLADYDGWHAASKIWARRLDDGERASLAWAALKALEPDHAEQVVQTVLDGSDMPYTLLNDVAGQAAFWAERARTCEVEAYCLATFKVMPKARQAAFLNHVQGGAAS